jgi:hypothetical protein
VDGSLACAEAPLLREASTGKSAGARRLFVIPRFNPAEDVKNFAKAAYTIRDGKIIYRK